MADSNELYSQIQSQMGQLNPQLDALAGADKYYKDKVNEAYGYNMPALKTAASLEGKMYSLPGDLMTQYDQEFGGQQGVSSSQRINDIMGRLGNQSALSNAAWGAADQAGARMDDVASSLAKQYATQVQAGQAKLDPLMSLWDRIYSEEQATKRAGMSSGSGYAGFDWDKIAEALGLNEEEETTTTPTATLPGLGIKSNTPQVVPTGSAYFDRMIGNAKGLDSTGNLKTGTPTNINTSTTPLLQSIAKLTQR